MGGRDVGLLQVLKGCGVQVRGGLMTIGPWPRGCPELVEGPGATHEARGRVISNFSKGHTPSRNPYWFDLRKFLILWQSRDYRGVKISPIIRVPTVESLKVTPLGSNNDVLGRGMSSMADADGCADEHIQGGGPEKLNSARGGSWGGVITWWSHFCRPLGGMITGEF